MGPQLDDETKTLDSATRARAFLAERGLDGGLTEFARSTRTAEMAAEACGCELGQIVKSLVFLADDRPILALVAGDRRGDTEAIARETGAGRVAIADARTALEATGYEVGGVCPFGVPEGLEVLMDDSLDRFVEVFVAAGTPTSVVRMATEELVQVTVARPAPVGK